MPNGVRTVVTYSLRDGRKESLKAGRVAAAADQMAMRNVATENQNNIGSMPKYADKATTERLPAPSIKRLPTKA